MDEKMRKDEEKIESVQKELHGLSSHIIKTASEMDQHIDVIEKEYRDTQEEFKHQGNPKFPRIAKYERLSKKIEKWVEKVESLKDTIQTWLKKSKLLEEHTKRWNDDVKTWNETASNTGKQIDLLKLQVEVEEGIYRMIAQVAGGSWIEKVQNRIKTQQISFCNFKEKLETMKSPNWKHINCRDSHIATAWKYLEKEFQRIKDLEKRINENWNEIEICQFQIREMKENLKTWITKADEKHTEFQQWQEDIRLFSLDGMITEFKGNLTDLSEHIKICKNLQKEADEWYERRGKLEKKVRQTDEDIKILEKWECKIKQSIRVMNQLLEAEEKKRLSGTVAYFKSKQSTPLDKIIDHNKNISRIKRSKEEFGKIRHDLPDIRDVVRKQLKQINFLTFTIDQKRKCLVRRRDQENKESDAVEKELENSNTILERKYDKIKQKLEHWIASECLLDNIKDFCREIDRFNKDLQAKYSVWEKKNNDLKREIISYENYVSQQEELILSVELRTSYLISRLEVKNKRDDCISKVHQQQVERDKCKTMWRNHQERIKKFTDEAEEMMKWLKIMPKSANLSSQIFQSRKETGVKSLQEELLRKNGNIEHLYAELYYLAGEISILRVRMEPVECMINEPSVFEVDSPWRTWGKKYSQKIAYVFKKFDGWNENYEELKKNFSKYYEKSRHLKESIKDWKECAESKLNFYGILRIVNEKKNV